MVHERRGRERRRHEGPRLYREGRYWKGDFRPWSGPRLSLRDPKAPGWPHAGERTEDPEVAHLWSLSYLDLYRDELRRAQSGRRKLPLLGEAVDAYLPHRQNLVEPNTYGVDRTATNHLLEHFGRSATMRKVANELQDLVDKRLAQGYARTTVNTLITAWSPFFRWVGFTEQNNPALHIRRPVVAKVDVGTWSDDEMGQLREAADWVDRHPVKGYMPPARRMVEVFVCTGVRQQEGFALEWSDFRPDREAVRINWQLIKHGTGRKPLKGKLARTSYVLPEFWQHHQDKTGPVLPGRNGGWALYRSQRNLLRRILDVAKLGETGDGFHRFRHTFARLFLARGGRLEELRLFLGHKSIVTTQYVYGHMHEDVAIENARRRLRVVP